MKTILVLAFIILAGFASNAQGTSITIKDLPAKAQNFIALHFPNLPLTYAGKDMEPGDMEYEVVLKGGIKIEFDSEGDWEEIKGNGTHLKSSLLPVSVATYLENNYKSQGILKAEKNRNGYEVELANGFELEFDSSGKFLRIDK